MSNAFEFVARLVFQAACGKVESVRILDRLNEASRAKHGHDFRVDFLLHWLENGCPESTDRYAESSVKQYKSACSTAVELAGFNPEQFGLVDNRGAKRKDVSPKSIVAKLPKSLQEKFRLELEAEEIREQTAEHSAEISPESEALSDPESEFNDTDIDSNGDDN